jgi:hypothetical protein
VVIDFNIIIIIIFFLIPHHDNPNHRAVSRGEPEGAAAGGRNPSRAATRQCAERHGALTIILIKILMIIITTTIRIRIILMCSGENRRAQLLEEGIAREGQPGSVQSDTVHELLVHDRPAPDGSTAPDAYSFEACIAGSFCPR